MHSKKIVKSTFLFLTVIFVSVFFIKSNELENRKQTQSQDLASKAPNDKQQSSIQTLNILSDEDIQRIINSMGSPSEYERIRFELKGFSAENKDLLFRKLLKILSPIKDLKVSLRALDLLRLVLKEKAPNNSAQVIPMIKDILSENNPLLTRNALRILGEIPTEESALLLRDNLNNEDTALSAEAMKALASLAKYNPNLFTEKTYDDEVIDTYANFKRHEQDTLEIQTQTLQTLTAIKDKESFQYLTDSLFANDVNLALKNQIAAALPRWGEPSRPFLEKYLAYLKTLKIEKEALADQDRRDGIQITQKALNAIR